MNNDKFCLFSVVDAGVDVTVANVENLAPEKDAMVKMGPLKGSKFKPNEELMIVQLKLSLFYGFESKLVFSEIILCEKLSKLGLVLHDLQKRIIVSVTNPHCNENPIYLFLFWEYLFQMISIGSLQCSLDTRWLKVDQFKYVQSTEKLDIRYVLNKHKVHC
jgi:hypothetical protein